MSTLAYQSAAFIRAGQTQSQLARAAWFQQLAVNTDWHPCCITCYVRRPDPSELWERELLGFRDCVATGVAAPRLNAPDFQLRLFHGKV